MNTATSATAVHARSRNDSRAGRNSNSIARRSSTETDPNAPRILVCCGTGCKAVGSLDVLEAMQNGRGRSRVRTSR